MTGGASASSTTTNGSTSPPCVKLGVDVVLLMDLFFLVPDPKLRNGKRGIDDRRPDGCEGGGRGGDGGQRGREGGGERGEERACADSMVALLCVHDIFTGSSLRTY